MTRRNMNKGNNTENSGLHKNSWVSLDYDTLKLKIPKWKTEIVNSEDRLNHGQQNETKDRHSTQNTALGTKAGVTWTLQN